MTKDFVPARRRGGRHFSRVVSEGNIGRSVGLVLTDHVTERCPEHGVETIVIQIKRKWPQLHRKRQCNPAGISRN